MSVCIKHKNKHKRTRMSSENKNQVIETDGEPDDFMAMLIHGSKNVDKMVNLTVIVGESNASKKISAVVSMFEQIKKYYPTSYESVNVVKGLSSTKKYPFTNEEGKVVEEKGTEDSPEEREIILSEYKKVYGQNPTLVYMMKPPREAVCLITTDQDFKCEETIVHAYGSFNWRTLGRSVEEWNKFMSSYKKFYYYDSFTAIGEKNSGNYGGNDPTILELINNWNTLVLNKSIADLANAKDEEGKKRSEKIISNISAGMKTQFVMADVVLFIDTLPDVPVILDSMAPYPVWKPSEDSNAYIFNNIDEAKRRADVVKLVESVQHL